VPPNDPVHRLQADGSQSACTQAEPWRTRASTFFEVRGYLLAMPTAKRHGGARTAPWARARAGASVATWRVAALGGGTRRHDAQRVRRPRLGGAKGIDGCQRLWLGSRGPERPGGGRAEHIRVRLVTWSKSGRWSLPRRYLGGGER
jgi:hypothetical protein